MADVSRINVKTTDKHSVLISEKLFQDIKEYCQYNNLKIGDYINTILKEKFMTEKYGESPFDEFRKKIEDNTVEIDPKIQQAIADNFWEMMDDKKTEDVEETKGTIAPDITKNVKFEITENVDPVTLSHVYNIEKKEQENMAEVISEKWDGLIKNKIENTKKESPKKDSYIKEIKNYDKSEKPTRRKLK